MMTGNTRRMMTNLRISDNIVKYNNPTGPTNTFGDMLVCTAVEKTSKPENDYQYGNGRGGNAYPQAKLHMNNANV